MATAVPQGVSLKINHKHRIFAADPDLMVGFLISNGQSSQLVELIVLVGGKKMMKQTNKS